jgi:hypothetical protein
MQQQQDFNTNVNARLFTLEQTTQNTDTKIDVILNKLDSMSNPLKQRKISPQQNNINEYEMDGNTNPTPHPTTQQNGFYSPCTL